MQYRANRTREKPESKVILLHKVRSKRPDPCKTDCLANFMLITLIILCGVILPSVLFDSNSAAGAFSLSLSITCTQLDPACIDSRFDQVNTIVMTSAQWPELSGVCRVV